MAKITLINVPSLKDFIMTNYPPIGILSMSACLKKKGHKVNFIDADVYRYEPDQVIKILSKQIPDIIGIGVNISQVSHCTRYMNKIKKEFPNIPIVLGGPYVSAIGEDIFKDFPDLKYAIINESEFAIVELIEYIKGNISIDKVKNLIHSSKGKITRNKVERILNLDELPMPDYSLVKDNIDKYHGAYPSIASPSIAIMCSRGCPYNCTFCSSPKTWGRKVTYRSTDSVINEIIHIKKLIDAKEIFLVDDTMNIRPEWFMDLCDKIIKKDLHKDIFFKCPFRVNKNILNEKILRKAKEANFWMIFYGVENGNQKMLNDMNKAIKISEIINAFKLTRKAGICSYASFMIGNQGETKDTVNDSIKLLKKIMPDFSTFGIAIPFPGTKLYQIVNEKGLMTATDFKEYKYGDCILRTEKLNKEELEFLGNKANRIVSKLEVSFKYKILAKLSGTYKLHKLVKKGFYGEELWDTIVQRTMKKASCSVGRNKESNKIMLQIYADNPDITKKPVILKLWIDDDKQIIKLKKSEWVNLEFKLSNKNSGKKNIFLKWEVDRTWNPSKLGSSNDDRDIGITVKKIWAE